MSTCSAALLEHTVHNCLPSLGRHNCYCILLTPTFRSVGKSSLPPCLSNPHLQNAVYELLSSHLRNKIWLCTESREGKLSRMACRTSEIGTWPVWCHSVSLTRLAQQQN